jgi:NAD(P)-dependent dehydrogenase (short-subunit alcohol dehydrogenase family)
MSLEGKVALVTGGSRGLGRVMVEGLAAAGADVVVASRKQEACAVVADHVRDTYGRRALAIGCNVSHWAQCDALVEKVYAEFGRIDVLVNNAGLSPLYPSLDQVDEALFDKVLDLNLKGPFRLMALIGARMAAAGGGSIINITSAEAVRPSPHAAPYAAAKAALNNLTESVARAYGPTVRVNAIQCGAFLTDIATHWSPELVDELGARSALQRCGNPEEILGAALYFAGDQSSFCTGAILRLDGAII